MDGQKEFIKFKQKIQDQSSQNKGKITKRTPDLQIKHKEIIIRQSLAFKNTSEIETGFSVTVVGIR